MLVSQKAGMGPDNEHVYSVTDGNFMGSGRTRTEAAAAFLAGYGFNPDGTHWKDVAIPPPGGDLIDALVRPCTTTS